MSKYCLRLKTDEEVIAGAVQAYTSKDLLSGRSTLDSALFGATIMSPKCDVCKNRIEQCPGHYSVIQIPFPIVRAMCLKDFKRLIVLICPICSHFLCENAEYAKTLNIEARLKWIKKVVSKFTKNGEAVVSCPTCHKKVSQIKIMHNEPSLRICIVQQSQNTFDQINPIILHTLLQNFTQVEEGGFSEHFHPRLFMTTVIPIIPNKLRPKTITSSESTLTSYYKRIVEDVCPELERIYKTMNLGTAAVIDRGDQTEVFNKYYDELMTYYLLITDTGTAKTTEEELKIAKRKDRQHFDPHNPLAGRLKGKEHSIFNKGIISTRHNVSARTVLGGATNSPNKCVNIPFHIASKLTLLYPVYVQNLKLMKQLVASMSDPLIFNSVHIPKLLYIISGYTGWLNRISPKDAVTRAAMLKPGDKVAISLINGDLVMQSRFPVVREEGCSTLEVIKDNNSIITIPLSICKMKTADFDGDESQVYVPNNHTTDIESLMLHSIAAQLIGYKTGELAVWYSQDAPYGINKMCKGAVTSILNGKRIMKGGKHITMDVLEIINSFLPKDLTYIDDSIEIIEGKLSSSKTNIMNMELHKYMSFLYGTDYTSSFMDRIIQLAYDLNRDFGNTLGFEMRIRGGDKAKQRIKAIVDKTYSDMCLLEQTSNPNKSILQINAVEKQKTAIKDILFEVSKGSILEKLGYLKKFQDEFYQTVVLLDHIVVESDRIKPILAEFTRVNSAYPRYSIDPRAYGYISTSFSGDVDPISHVYDVKQQRFAIYVKTSGTANQGYSNKRMSIAFGSLFADFNGMVVSSRRIVSTQYNSCGLQPRLFVQQPLHDINLTKQQFEKKYSDKHLVELFESINFVRKRYSMLTSFIKGEHVKPTFSSGFNFEQYINNNSVKNKPTPQNIIEDLIKDLHEFYCPSGFMLKYVLENIKLHEYYFRVKLSNVKITEETAKNLINLLCWMLVNGGDPVGGKAAIAISEPMTQASLHAIRAVGSSGVEVERVERVIGFARAQEILSGFNCKNNVITIKLYEDDQRSTNDFANEQETFYFNDVYTKLELLVCKKVPREVCKLHPNLNLEDAPINNYFVISIWNLQGVSGYNIHVTEIINRLMDNYDEILFITGHIVSMSEFKAYIFFKPTITFEMISLIMDEWSKQKTETVVHGKYLRNCFVSENKNLPGHYLIEANEVKSKNKGFSFYNRLILDERIDPLGCKISDPRITQSMYGVFETSARHHEELLNMASTIGAMNGLLERHFKVVSDATFVNGKAIYASRNGLKHDKYMDAMRLVHFEEPKEMIRQILRFGDKQPVSDPISASVFGELPRLGTGVSKVTLYAK